MTTSATATVESLCNLLKRSRLFQARDIRAMYQHWRRYQSMSIPGEVKLFLKWMVINRYVTNYQAQQLTVGRTDQFFLNHYKLLDLIGTGQMAGIFKATHTLGHVVAIKVVPASKSRDPLLLARFQREGRMAVRLKHPNVVRTYHLGRAGGRHYLVMEHLEGETLENVLKRRGKLPFAEGVRLVHQALQGLQHIHEQKLVHRDLKPANLMLVPLPPPSAPDNTLHATLKILDIGLGRELFDESEASGEDAMRLTTDGMILGTSDYMAPEQARDSHHVDVRADIYSLGCVLYHLLAGQSPFAGSDPIQQLIRHASEPPKPIRQHEPSVPEGLQAILNRMLAKSPDQRYATPAQAAQALQAFLDKQAQNLFDAAALNQSYLKWVEAQPDEEADAAPLVEQRWYFRHNGQAFGPCTTAQIQQLAASGKLSPDDPLWMEGDDPALAVAAKIAVDFSSLPAPAKETAVAKQTKATPPAPPAPPIRKTEARVSPSVEEMGYDPDTGQIFDRKKFENWQRQERLRKEQEAAAQPESGPSLREVFHKARVQLDQWVDLDQNRRLILAGDLELIRQDPAVQQLMHAYADYGQDLLHRLWHHLQFMVENRRKYYSVFT